MGALLALNFALDFPQKVRSLALIASPYKVPSWVMRLQNTIFSCMPKSVFEKMAFSKADCLALGRSMRGLNFAQRLKDIACPTLVICGEKDLANLKAAHYLSQHIAKANLQILANTGHVISEENPQKLAAILDAHYCSHT